MAPRPIASDSQPPTQYSSSQVKGAKVCRELDSAPGGVATWCGASCESQDQSETN